MWFQYEVLLSLYLILTLTVSYNMLEHLSDVILYCKYAVTILLCVISGEVRL